MMWVALNLSSKGDGEFNRSTSIQTHTCTAGVWPLITRLTNSSYQCLGPSAICTESLSQFNQHSGIVTPSLCSGIYYLRLCLHVCEGGVKEQRRVSKWKGFPESRGIKVADGSTSLSLFVFVGQLKAINFYLTAEPLVPSILHCHLTAFSGRLMRCVCLILTAKTNEVLRRTHQSVR